MDEKNQTPQPHQGGKIQHLSPYGLSPSKLESLKMKPFEFKNDPSTRAAALNPLAKVLLPQSSFLNSGFHENPSFNLNFSHPGQKQLVLPANAVCNECTEMFQSTNFVSSYQVKRGLFTMKANARSGLGCRLCLAIIQNFRPSLSARLHQPITAILPHEKDVNLTIGVRGLGGIAELVFREDNTQTVLEYKLARKSEGAAFVDPASRITKTRSSNRDMKAESLYEMVRHWIEQCDSKHLVCPKDIGPLPTRVIDVSDEENPRLVISSGRAAPYAALSYCWGVPEGNKQFVTTTLKTLEEHLKGFQLAALPPSIQDAIFVTRKLRIQYLWVDAFCILQDSKEDKDVEISRMGAIYKNSNITICAASSKSSWDGFLGMRENTSIQGAVPIPIGINKDLGSFHTNLLLYEKKQGKGLLDPLHKRAWTLQETTLSPRLLIYARTQLYFVCKEQAEQNGGITSWDEYCEATDFQRLERFHTENSTNHAGKPGPSLRLDHASIKLNEDKKLPPPKEKEIPPEKVWEKVVIDYSRRQLTEPSDKLPAISSLAAEFNDQVGDVYLAGHWRRWIPGSLLWSVADAPLHSSRPKAWRAPSWSWLSIDSDIMYTDYSAHSNEDCIAEVIHCDVVPEASYAPYGRISRAALRIKTFLLEGYHINTESLSHSYSIENIENTPKPVVIGWMKRDPLFEDDAKKTTKRTNPLIGVYTDCSGLFETCSFLPIKETTSGKIEGLVVRSTGGEAFERVGWFSSNYQCNSFFLKGEKTTIDLV